jgi:hypothetical protein
LYGAARPEFPPRPDHSRDERTEGRTGSLSEQLILELAAMTLRREDGADHGDTRPLDERERIARGKAKREG